MSGLVLTLLTFLAVSLLLYAILAGADFGAGILELFLGRTHHTAQRKLISQAMAPVWEANHVWLILAVVILFMGFPEIYTLASVYLHLPLLAVLVGIVARGCAFTFRHYDTLDKAYYRVFSRTFAWSSVWTSFFLGTLAGALMLGKIEPQATDFYHLYIASWWNPFAMMTGVFACCLFAFLAAVYLVGETTDTQMKTIFLRKAAWANIGVVVSGLLVFLAAESAGYSLGAEFLSHPASIGCFVFATLLWMPFWLVLPRSPAVIVPRLLGAAIVGFVLLGWFALQFPAAVRIYEGGQVKEILFADVAAPEATQKALLAALIIGSALIFPALTYLFKVFKWEALDQ